MCCSVLRSFVNDARADGDAVIAFFDAESLVKDGKPYKNTCTWYMRLKDGKIVEVNAMFDSLAFDDLWHRVKPE
jgi:uncharacterized protein